MPNSGGIIKSLQNIMRKNQGGAGDAQRIEQQGLKPITLHSSAQRKAQICFYC